MSLARHAHPARRSAPFVPTRIRGLTDGTYETAHGPYLCVLRPDHFRAILRWPGDIRPARVSDNWCGRTSMTNETERRVAERAAYAMRTAAIGLALERAAEEADPTIAYGCVDWFRYGAPAPSQEADERTLPEVTRDENRLGRAPGHGASLCPQPGRAIDQIQDFGAGCLIAHERAAYRAGHHGAARLADAADGHAGM